MTISHIQSSHNWRAVADAARTTVGKEPGTGEPSAGWKRRFLLAEHSPIRKLTIEWTWQDLPYWVSVHFVRHKFGIEHFVSTQRSDRTGVPRDDLPQNAPVTHECHANAQAVITISRKRLCQQAAAETRQAWRLMLGALNVIEPELESVCVPECVYRGFCPEMASCGLAARPEFPGMVANYRKTTA